MGVAHKIDGGTFWGTATEICVVRVSHERLYDLTFGDGEAVHLTQPEVMAAARVASHGAPHLAGFSGLKRAPFGILRLMRPTTSWRKPSYTRARQRGHANQ